MPCRVGEELDLDVPRPLDVALEEDRVVAEAGLRLALRRLERLVQLGRVPDDAHAAAAAARRGLDEEREADLLRRSRSGSVGTPASAAIRFASSLSPAARMTSGGGPTQVRPASVTASASASLSARKP